MYKKHSSFSFTAFLFMPRLSEHERPGAIGILRLGCVFQASPDITIAICQLYSTSEVVTGLLGQLKVDTGLTKNGDRH